MNEYYKKTLREPGTGLCQFQWCPDPVRGDGGELDRCEEHHRLFLIPKPSIQQVEEIIKENQCRAQQVPSCTEVQLKEGLCVWHYNNKLELAALRREKLMSWKQTPEQKAAENQLKIDGINDLVDLDWWFNTYGEKELPAKFMNPDYYILLNWDDSVQGSIPDVIKALANLSTSEKMALSDALKELDGELVNNGTHVWKFTGRKHYMREGTHNHFKCEPI